MGQPRRTRTPIQVGHQRQANISLSQRERRLLERIQKALSVDLLNREMQGLVKPKDDYTRGHCYVATEAFYYLYGKRAGYRPRGRDYHWWLEHKVTGAIVDPTLPQVSEPFDYETVRSRSFMPQSPKAATKELMRRVRAIEARPGKRW